MNPSAVLTAVDAIVLETRRMGYRSYADVSRALLRASHDYPPGGPIWIEIRARAGRFRRAGERQEAAKKARAA